MERRRSQPPTGSLRRLLRAAWVLALLLVLPGTARSDTCQASTAATPTPTHATAGNPARGPAGGAVACFAPPPPDHSCLTVRPTCDGDLAVARIAWKFFENNYQKANGLTNAADAYPSTTMWDVASALAATVAARELSLLNGKDFDDRIVLLLGTLSTLKLYNDEAPNKAYNTATAVMSDYNNKPSDGIGFSALDLARMASWLNILACLHPKHASGATAALKRWKYGRMIHDGQMFGTVVDPAKKTETVVQEGRLGYEQYGGKVFAMLGFDQRVAVTYRNEFATTTQILGVPIGYDARDPRKLGAYNYVVTESYALDAMEFGLDAENTALTRNVFEVQKRRWQKTGIVTAVSEDNIDRAPYFLYNTIFAAGSAWNTITDTGDEHEKLKTISTKAAFSLVTLFPGDPYSRVLLDAVSSAYDPAKGWYSGIYEAGLGYNKALTANTNGVILEAILYKMMGPLNRACARCGRGVRFAAPKPEPVCNKQVAAR